jgi:DNA polymerase III subunit epsilon
MPITTNLSCENRTTMKKVSKNFLLNTLETDIAVTALHATGDFKGLRKINLNQDTRFSQRAISNPRIGICIDTETTGLNRLQDKIIKTGIVAFECDPGTAAIIRVINQLPRGMFHDIFRKAS